METSKKNLHENFSEIRVRAHYIVSHQDLVLRLISDAQDIGAIRVILQMYSLTYIISVVAQWVSIHYLTSICM